MGAVWFEFLGNKNEFVRCSQFANNEQILVYLPYENT